MQQSRFFLSIVFISLTAESLSEFLLQYRILKNDPSEPFSCHYAVCLFSFFAALRSAGTTSLCQAVLKEPVLLLSPNAKTQNKLSKATAPLFSPHLAIQYIPRADLSTGAFRNVRRGPPTTSESASQLNFLTLSFRDYTLCLFLTCKVKSLLVACAIL